VLAEVLTSAASWNSEQSLLTYIVPTDLQDKICEGQLVAIPYGERLVEGIVWNILPDDEEIWTDEENVATPLVGVAGVGVAGMGVASGGIAGGVGLNEHVATPTRGVVGMGIAGENVAWTGGGATPEYTLRPITAILDIEPALLPHQRALAEWMAEYYVTPLAQTAMMMLPPGLMQRSQIVLHLAKHEQDESGQSLPSTSLRTQALIGLLLTDGELDTEQLKKMLGPTRAKAIIKEALATGMVERQPQLRTPRAKKRIKRVVRLIAQREALTAWRQRTEAQLQQNFVSEPPPGRVGLGVEASPSALVAPHLPDSHFAATSATSETTETLETTETSETLDTTDLLDI
jgi:primosomal protein N'